MKLVDILIEGILTSDEAYRVLANKVHELIHFYSYLQDLAANAETDKKAKFLVASAKARWFSKNYLSTRGSIGLQDMLKELQRDSLQSSKEIRAVTFLPIHSIRSVKEETGETASKNFATIEQLLPIILRQLANTVPAATDASRLASLFEKGRDSVLSRAPPPEEKQPKKREREWKAPPREDEKLHSQQMRQSEEMVNQILNNLPENIRGEIRNSIARSGNKLIALRQELTTRGIKL